METPAAAPSQPGSEILPDFVPQPPSVITWMSFSGSPEESSGDFIQAIQRVAFQQGHVRDDRWIADYIATCFNGDALHWYSELDSKTQNSWKKLRTALLRRYPTGSPSSAPPEKPSQSPNTRDSSSPPSRRAKKNSGLIEVLGDKSVARRYLAASPGSAPSNRPAQTPAHDASPAPFLDVTTKSELIEALGDKVTVKLYPAASPGSARTVTPPQIPATRNTSSTPVRDATAKSGLIEPTQTPATSDTPSAPSRDTKKKAGLIEVLGDKNKSLGYLCLDAESLVEITKAEASAAVVNLPSQLTSEPIQLSLDGIPGNKRTNFRNLGLSLLVSRSKEDPDHLPDKIKIVQEWDDYGDGVSFEYELGVPTPSELCKGKREGTSVTIPRPPIATWILACCGDNPSQRGATAVWKYEKYDGELRIRWLMDDDCESELGAYIQQESSNLNLHVHRTSDMQEAGRFFEEGPVRFIFRPTQ